MFIVAGFEIADEGGGVPLAPCCKCDDVCDDNDDATIVDEDDNDDGW